MTEAEGSCVDRELSCEHQPIWILFTALYRMKLLKIQLAFVMYVMNKLLYNALCQQNYYLIDGSDILRNTSFVLPNGSFCVSSEMIDIHQQLKFLQEGRIILLSPGCLRRDCQCHSLCASFSGTWTTDGPVWQEDWLDPPHDRKYFAGNIFHLHNTVHARSILLHTCSIYRWAVW